jgi:hypothetical protein
MKVPRRRSGPGEQRAQHAVEPLGEAGAGVAIHPCRANRPRRNCYLPSEPSEVATDRPKLSAGKDRKSDGSDGSDGRLRIVEPGVDNCLQARAEAAGGRYVCVRTDANGNFCVRNPRPRIFLINRGNFRTWAIADATGRKMVSSGFSRICVRSSDAMTHSGGNAVPRSDWCPEKRSTISPRLHCPGAPPH